MLQSSLHPFRNFDSQERETILNGLTDGSGQHQTERTGRFVRFIHDAVIMVKLVELFHQIINIVGDNRRTMVIAGFLHCKGEAVNCFYQLNFLGIAIYGRCYRRNIDS